MARIRTIKPSFWTDRKIQSLSIPTRLLFIGLFNYADDEGRFQADPRLVKAAVFPIDDEITVSKVECMLSELSLNGRVRIYEIDGETYGDIPKFKDHQVINRPSKSMIPQFREDAVKHTGVSHDASHGEEEWNGMEKEEEMDSLSETEEPAADSPVLMTFQTDGKIASWNLLESKVQEYKGAFPSLDVMSEIRRAAQWLRDNPGKRKTARGMPAFLFRWLSNSQNKRGGTSKSRNAGPQSYAMQPSDLSDPDAMSFDPPSEPPRFHKDGKTPI